MAEASLYNAGLALDHTASAAISAGEVLQLPDGRAAVIPVDVDSGKLAGAQTSGVYKVTKTATQVWIDGADIYWDHSANSATAIPPLVTGDRDFFMGTAVGDAASAATTGYVNLNVHGEYIIDIHRDGGDTAIVKTVVGSTTVEVPQATMRGGSFNMLLGTTAEAQKVDWLSKRSFALSSNPVLEAIIDVVVNADADVGDLNVGFANGTHASSADSITEHAFFHFDMGADTDLDAQSTDGTTTVGATDTTINWTAGTPIFLCIDGRDPTNMKFYVNCVEVLSATANLGDIQLATGPLKALVHLEKSSNDSAGEVQCDMLRVRTSQG